MAGLGAGREGEALREGGEGRGMGPRRMREDTGTRGGICFECLVLLLSVFPAGMGNQGTHI